ncbi:hypothetical protein HGRIS_003760 [Hohenbuehelia grisea]|uniref:Metal homeostatis protein bsd2 n=1 Tax=Hohenbuehelia grisea TaxID=104357 RepID=A0ABR3JGG5_9AGAR
MREGRGVRMKAVAMGLSGCHTWITTCYKAANVRYPYPFLSYQSCQRPSICLCQPVFDSSSSYLPYSSRKIPNMPTRYAALPDDVPVTDRTNELEAAFDDGYASDGDLDHSESTPLNHHSSSRDQAQRSDAGVADAQLFHTTTTAIPGAYDFERDYDYPPPGSPPAPSAFARPNDIGNSNGQMPTSPVRTIPAEQQHRARGGFFRRTVGALLPTHYARVATEEGSSRPVRGGGVENDGVFANVMAKPQPGRVITTEDGDVRVVPEDSVKEAPPSYADAQADAVPPYWETTVHAPAALEAGEFMIIDDLPSGSFWIFGLNMFISFFFQFVGFLLTFLLHTSHAAKYGSRAGLGLTLIQYGFYSRAAQEEAAEGTVSDEDRIAALLGRADPPQPSSLFDSPPPQADSMRYTPVSSKDWLSFLLMTLGWFLLLSSFIGFYRVKRWEKSIREASAPDPSAPEDVVRDRAIQNNLRSIFGVSLPAEDRPSQAAQDLSVRQDVNGSVIVIPSQELLEEARLARDLRAAGLI